MNPPAARICVRRNRNVMMRLPRVRTCGPSPEGKSSGTGILSRAAAPADSFGDESGHRSTDIEEHRGLFATEGRKAGPLEETLLARNREQFLYSSLTRALFAELDQLGSDTPPVVSGMHG